jgi:hypothetical protein
MGFDWGNLVESGLGILFPPLDSALDQGRTEEGLAQQQQAADEARGMMGEQWDYLRGMNDPLIGMSDYQLQMLQQGIDRGDFQGNENLFNNYSVYTPQEYKPLSPYQNNEQQAQFSGAPAAITYNPNNQPSIGNTNTVAAPQLAGQRQFQNVPGQPDAFTYNQQQPQFSPYQQTQQQPQQYIAGQAQNANYWSPDQFNMQNDPILQKAIANANESTQASAAAQGSQLSGATLQELNENAVDLTNQYGQQAFNRWTTQQGMNQQAQNYQNEDVYNRYLNNVGIRSAEGQQALGQYNLNRGFGQQSNLENAAMGNQLWNTGFQNQLAAQGQNYGQYAQNRDYAFDTTQAMRADDLNRFNAQANQYNTGRNYDLSRFGAEAGQFNQNVQNQLAVQGQGWQQAYDPYLTNLGQYNQNRAFNYGRYMDYGDQLSNAYQMNTGNQQLANAMQYQQATDAYNRSADRGQTGYGMVGDLVNLGMGARQNIGQSAADYWGSTADLSIGEANAYAAAMAAQNEGTGLLSSLGL